MTIPIKAHSLPALHDRIWRRARLGDLRFGRRGTQDAASASKARSRCPGSPATALRRPRRKRRHDPAAILLDESRQFQTQTGSIAQICSRMIMANDLDHGDRRYRAMAVMENEIRPTTTRRRSSIVHSAWRSWFPATTTTSQRTRGPVREVCALRTSRAVMDEIAKDNQALCGDNPLAIPTIGPVDRIHSPERDQPSGRTPT